MHVLLQRVIAGRHTFAGPRGTHAPDQSAHQQCQVQALDRKMSRSCSAASSSISRAIGIVMCVSGIVTPFFGETHVQLRAVLQFTSTTAPRSQR